MSAEELIRLEEVAVVIDPRDDLAVAKRAIPAGTTLAYAGRSIRLPQAVPAKHKFALAPLASGGPARLYGACAGRVEKEIAAGELVTTANLSDRVEGLEAAGAVSAAQEVAPPDPMPFFQGYDRGPAGAGTRNHLLILYTVPCAAGAAAQIAAACRSAFGFDRAGRYADYARSRAGGRPAEPEAPRFPGVDDIALIHHDSGCGMPDHGDVETLLRWLAHYIRNPNVGGALVVGLGCEKSAVERLEAEHLPAVREMTGKPILTLAHQRVGSEDALIRAGIDRAHELLCRIGAQRTPIPLSRLVLGTKCGGSDGFSGISANPALGWVSDRVAAAGGMVLLPEVPEMVGAEQALAARAATPAVAEQVLAAVQRYVRLAALSGVRLGENLSRGNVEDGLLTIQIKSLGAVRKGGTGPIRGVLEYAEWAEERGLLVLDTPGYDVVSCAALPASGAALICFTTGLGTPCGNPVAPVLKISSNTATARRMPDVIDFDAGSVIEGSETVAECGARLLDAVLAAAAGRRTCSEQNEHGECEFWRRQCNL